MIDLQKNTKATEILKSIDLTALNAADQMLADKSKYDVLAEGTYFVGVHLGQCVCTNISDLDVALYNARLDSSSSKKMTKFWTNASGEEILDDFGCPIPNKKIQYTTVDTSGKVSGIKTAYVHGVSNMLMTVGSLDCFKLTILQNKENGFKMLCAGPGEIPQELVDSIEE